VGEHLVERARHPFEVERLDEQARVADLPRRPAPEEAPELAFHRAAAPGGLLLERSEGAELSLGVDDALDRRGAESPDQLVFEIGHADVEAELLQFAARTDGAEAGTLEAAPEVPLLSVVAETGEPEIEPAGAESLQVATDRLRASDRDDGDSLALQVVAAAPGERLEGFLVAAPLHEHDGARRDLLLRGSASVAHRSILPVWPTAEYVSGIAGSLDTRAGDGSVVRGLRAAARVRKAARAYDVSFARVALWGLHLHRKRGFRLAEAFAYGLMDPAISPTRLAQHTSRLTLRPLQRGLNPGGLLFLTEQKAVFYRICEELRLPTPRVHAVFLPGGRGWAGDRLLTSRDECLALLEAIPGDFVLKPSGGALGRDVEVVRRDGKGYLDALGNRLDVEGAYALTTRGGGTQAFVVQERLRNHPDLVALTGSEGLQTLRLVMLVDGRGKPRLLTAKLKIITGSALVDNIAYGLNGNASTELALGEGRLAPALVPSADETLPRALTHHPVTGAELAGFTMPLWEETRALAERAALAFLPLRSFGWDVAVTPDGPVLIEANALWDPPNRSERMPAILAVHRAALGSANGSRRQGRPHRRRAAPGRRGDAHPEELVRNRVAFSRYCAALGLPVPELYAASFPGSAGWAPGLPVIARETQWLALLRDELPDEFVLRPARSDATEPASVWTRSDGVFTDAHGLRVDARGLYARLAAGAEDRLIQERVRNHPDLGAGDELRRARFQTVFQAGRVSVTRSARDAPPGALEEAARELLEAAAPRFLPLREIVWETAFAPSGPVLLGARARFPG
jgi:putative polysaccharide biosynthesis protein